MEGNTDIFENKEKNKNYILVEINIEEKSINKDIRIINSFEEFKRYNDFYNDEEENDYKYINEKEIKDNCIIKINNRTIKFQYFYEFKEKGKFNIKYSFKKNIKNLACIFSECNSLTNIDLSNFNTQNVTNMYGMFIRCDSLTEIDLSNFNTKNVTNMFYMFFRCNSLTNIIISSFNKKFLSEMNLFSECNSLIKKCIK